MSVFDDHITTDSCVTETIFKYACEECRKNYEGLDFTGSLFESWDILYQAMISKWVGDGLNDCLSPLSKDNIITMLNRAQDRYQREVNQKYARKFEFYHFDEPNYLEGMLKRIYYEPI